MVLTASRVSTPGGGGEDEGVPDPVGGHLLGRLIVERLPVAVTEIDGDIVSARRELSLDVGDDLLVEPVEGAHSTEVVVVGTHLIEPLRGDSPAPGDILQKWTNLLGSLGATEGENEEGIIGIRLSVRCACVHRTYITNQRLMVHKRE